MIVDMDKPIFVAYMNVDGMGRQRADEKMHDFADYYGSSGMQFIIMPVKDKQETKIELLWKGETIEKSSSNDNKSLNEVRETLNFIIGMMEQGIKDETLKSRLRDFQLKKILDADNTEENLQP
jgi:hypothetical protein